MVCSRPPSVKSSVLPTAQTSLADTAVTPVRKLFPFVVGNGFGLGTRLHEVPFQCSVSVWLPFGPAAHTSEEEIAVTLERRASPEMAGVETMLHEVPFQCSASVPSSPSPTAPTAQTSLELTAATAARVPPPRGVGVGTTAQEVPSQCSASVASVTPTAPTAQASPGETAATPRRSFRPEPTFALATTDHLVPFQCSVSVRSTDPTTWNPTAHASVLESAEAAFNSLFSVPLLGLLRAFHVVPSKCSISVLKANDDGPRNVPTAHTSEAVFAETPESWLKSLLRFGVGWMVHVVRGFTPKEVAEAATDPRTMAVRPASPTMATRSRPIHLPIGDLLGRSRDSRLRHQAEPEGIRTVQRFGLNADQAMA